MPSIVILAAGHGTRMKSQRPKVLHRAAGQSMLGHVIEAAKALNPSCIVVVTGHGADAVEGAFADAGVQFVRQTEQLGTAHAFLMARPMLEATGGDVMVLYGDTPLLRPETLQAAMDAHTNAKAGLSVITGDLENPTGYGRIVRDAQGQVLRIVEEKSASKSEKEIKETNSGVYVFSQKAWRLAGQIGNSNNAGEYYLTDILEQYRQEHDIVQAFKVADPSEFEGVNDRVQLAKAEAVLRERIRTTHLRAGVTMLDPSSTYIDTGVALGQDVILYPGVVLEGRTSIGANTVVGPHCHLINATIGERVNVQASTVVQDSSIGHGSDIGPFARFRPGSILGEDAHVGNFTEIKNSTLARGVKAGHLAYIGDSDVGEDTNIGAGVIVANYDGVKKHRSTIGAGVFVGSDSVIVSPRRIGDGAFVAAGSVVQDDVPEGDLAVARAKQRNLEGWSRRYWQKALDAGLLKHPWIAAWLGTKKP